MERAQEEVAKLEIEGVSGAGMVKVLMTGKHDIKKVSIDDAVMDDKEMLEEVIRDGDTKQKKACHLVAVYQVVLNFHSKLATQYFSYYT
mgnify:CR=1 FL=1